MCLPCLVTSLVTFFKEFRRFENSIQANWNEAFHPAMRLEIVAMCKFESGMLYLVNKTILSPNATSFTLTGLMPGSQCEFTLKAVYNPASIDKGISATCTVLAASKMASRIMFSTYT